MADGNFRPDLSYCSVCILAIYLWILLQYGSFGRLTLLILETKRDLINRMGNNQLKSIYTIDCTLTFLLPLSAGIPQLLLRVAAEGGRRVRLRARSRLRWRRLLRTR